MQKILISWLAYNHDFIKEEKEGEHKITEVNENGTTVNFHRYFWEHDKHILLYASEEHQPNVEFLDNYLKRSFPDQIVEPTFLPIKDVIDLKEVKAKVERKLIELGENQIDIFFSPGTSIMQVAWYACHTSLKLKTRLLQVRPARFSRSKKPELLILHTEQDSVPTSAMIKAESSRQKKRKDHLLTQSIQAVYDKAFKVAQTDHVRVMIYGESGTGKEDLANHIHRESPRANRVFRAVNCAAFQDNLLSSQLFGHKKGAFTDAHEDKKGLFEICDGGTLFLDEIGDISPFMQQSLLRVLEEGEIWPLGANKARKVDVRLICATNRKLPERCKSGKFRWDLYYRLAVVELELPSLYERGTAETEEMIQYFLNSKRKLFKKSQQLRLSKAAKSKLISYTWPGNIRELENVIEQLYVFCKEKVEAEDLPHRMTEPPVDVSEKWTDVEAAHLQKLFGRYKGHKERVRSAAGYKSINTLKKKLKEYRIE